LRRERYAWNFLAVDGRDTGAVVVEKEFFLIASNKGVANERISSES